MKKNLYIACLICTLATLPLKLFSDETSISQAARDNQALWEPGAGASDGSYTAISLSMLGWGIGLAIGIAVLAAVLSDSN